MSQARRLALWLSLLCLWCVAGAAWAQGNTKFDHLKTGFALTGAHTTVRCESCHAGGLFKGTPKDCRTCHTIGTRATQNTVAMPANHIPTTLACDVCHGTQNFTATTFKHSNGIAPGQSCATCHDGTHAQGKGPTHIATKASCDSCHTTSRWDGARPDHSTFSEATNCADSGCHGSGATGKPGTHIPVSINCASCHSTTGWKPSKWNHSQVNVSACSTCHTGSFPPADGRPADHIPYSGLSGVNNCDSCHKGGFASWAPGKLHSNIAVSTNCASCHGGGYRGPGIKPTNHIPSVRASASAGCDSCHKGSFTTWATGKFHSNISTTTDCASCHLGSTYGLTAKPANALHANVSGTCEACHKSTAAWATCAKVDHSTYTASTTCTSCHNGSAATGKPAGHIPLTSKTNLCGACHTPGTMWTPSTWNHKQEVVTKACSTCHTGSFPPADGKPADHIPYALVAPTASANCDSCHSASTYSTWATGKLHTSFTSLSSQCSTCHTGSYRGPDGKPSNHIPYQAVTASATAGCETCHKGSFTSWATGKFHNNVSTAGQCASCHLSAVYGLTAKPANATHASVSGNCESCHKSTAAWATGAKVDHSLYNSTTNCASCHNGSNATGKPGTHIPLARNVTTCGACHSAGTTWTPTTWNHSQEAVTNCATCHTGAYQGPDGKPADHIPYASVSLSASANCSACHKGGYSSWAPGQYHTTYSPANQCATCHTGGYRGPDGKPSNHIPYQAVTASASSGCEACHKGSFTSWATGKFHNNVSTTSQCATCHLGSTYGLTSKPNNAIHTGVTGNCEGCHKSTASWASGTQVNHSSYTATTNCAGCHNGSAATGKPGNHIPTPSKVTTCGACHNAGTSWTPTKWNHTQETVINACSTCHTGGYPGPDGKPGNHIPYASIGATASANCDGCHKGTPAPASWSTGKFHTSYTVTSQCATCHTGAYLGPDGKSSNHIPYQSVTASASAGCESCHKSTTTWTTGAFHKNVTVTGQCNTCHNTASYGQTTKPAAHIPLAQLLNGTTMDCSACHTLTTAGGFATATMNHNNSQGAGSGWCKGCHLSSTAYLGNMEKKSASHLGSKTDCSTSGCHRPLGSRGTTYRSW